MPHRNRLWNLECQYRDVELTIGLYWSVSAINPSPTLDACSYIIENRGWGKSQEMALKQRLRSIRFGLRPHTDGQVLSFHSAGWQFAPTES